MKLVPIIVHFIHQYLIWFILASYSIAVLFPDFGLAIRQTHINIGTQIPLPLFMLALLLFNAGLGININELKQLWHRPSILMMGIVGNWLIPLLFMVLLSLIMRTWHNENEAQQILMGLALVIAMPIAGASTAWTQNANGNIALSLGLVLFTTALSPLFTPLIFHATGLMTLGDYSEDLHELASGNVVSFLNIWVVLPSIAGLITRLVIPTSLLDNSKPYLKLANYVILILLNYANSALTLPNAIHNPDFDFLLIIVFIVTLLCILTFYSGYYLGHILNVTRKDILSLMFGLGMNNNGTALVLASMTLTDHTEVMLPIIFYNLVQHIIASLVDSKRLFIRAVY